MKAFKKHLIVQPIKADATSKGGIVLTGHENMPIKKAEIVSAGEDFNDEFPLSKSSAEVVWYVGKPIELGDGLAVIHMDSVVAYGP